MYVCVFVGWFLCVDTWAYSSALHQHEHVAYTLCLVFLCSPVLGRVSETITLSLDALDRDTEMHQSQQQTLT